MRTIGLAALSILAIGCGAAPEATPGSTRPIYGGQAPDAPEHAAVVGLHKLSKRGVSTQPFCSGTLIRPDVVLTAAHCLDTSKGGFTFKTIAPSALAIYVGDDPPSDASIYGSLKMVSGTLIHPSYDRRRLRNDVALIRLSEQVPGVAPVPPLPANQGFTAQDVTDQLVLNFAGFGYDENRAFGVKLQVDGTLGSLGCTLAGCPSDGSDPAVVATQIAYSQVFAREGNDGIGPCNGDSGGPAFVYRQSGTYVGGITSYGDANCDVYGVSTRVDAFESFINAF